MKSQIFVLTFIAAVLLAVLAVVGVSAQGPQPQLPSVVTLGTAFTYQGQLKSSGVAVNDSCSMTFSLWDLQSGGAQIGGDQVVNPVGVTNGLFTVQLNGAGQFGANAFNGQERWLQVAVQCAGDGSLVTLSRQPLAAAPYALFSIAPWATSGDHIYYAKGNVGIGTTNPKNRLHINDTNTYIGTGTISSSGTTVTGHNTSFTTQLNLGDVIIANGQSRVVNSVVSDTSLVIESAFSPDLSAGTSFIYQVATGIELEKNVAGYLRMDVHNRANGAEVYSFYRAGNDLDTVARPVNASFGIGASGSLTGVYNSRAFVFGNSGTNGVSVVSKSASGDIRFFTGGATTSNLRATIDGSGNVGIGTASPQSTLQVAGNYIQFPTITGGPPPIGECSSVAHYGRVVVRTDGAINLYVCTSAGWQGK